MDLGVTVLDLTRLLFDDGASRPEIAQRRSGGVRFTCKGVEFAAHIHRGPEDCAGRTLRGWWVCEGDLEYCTSEHLTRDWGSYDYPGWYDMRVVDHNDPNFQGFALIEFEPVLGVWPSHNSVPDQGTDV